jgi:hypothetical protein
MGSGSGIISGARRPKPQAGARRRAAFLEAGLEMDNLKP